MSLKFPLQAKDVVVVGGVVEVAMAVVNSILKKSFHV